MCGGGLWSGAASRQCVGDARGSWGGTCPRPCPASAQRQPSLASGLFRPPTAATSAHLASLPPAPACLCALQMSPPARACSLEDLASGAVRGDVLANTTSVGMASGAVHAGEEGEGETPVPAAALAAYQLVFDAVYTPLHTRLLR